VITSEFVEKACSQVGEYSDEKMAEEFETFFHDLIARERAATKGSDEHRMIIRQLQGVRKTEIGAFIIEDYEMSAKLFVPSRLFVPVP